MVQITADIKDTPFDLDISLPITIGTLPVAAVPQGQFTQETQTVGFQPASEEVVVTQPSSEVKCKHPIGGNTVRTYLK